MTFRKNHAPQDYLQLRSEATQPALGEYFRNDHVVILIRHLRARNAIGLGDVYGAFRRRSQKNQT